MKNCIIVCLLSFLVSCTTDNGAVISNASWHDFSKKDKSYVVQRGDTLYAIAFYFDKDYQKLALANNLRMPYSLKAGQRLKIHYKKSFPKKFIAQKKRGGQIPMAAYKKITTRKKYVAKVYHRKKTLSSWLMPAHGKIITKFSLKNQSKGIDILLKKNTKIHAAQDGVVAYAGNGLALYGNLIIIKHSNVYLSAYGNNSKIFVKEGQRIKKGQLIAKSGLLPSHRYGLHFEIRKYGKPVNPLKFL